MIRYDAGTTNPTLLNRLGDWRDHEAWVDFVTRYDPVIRLSCRRYRLDAETTEELCQRVWIDLARRMRTFRYDPGKTFRGWLRRLCQSRAIDLLRKKKADAVRVARTTSRPSRSWQDASADIEVDEDAAVGTPAVLLRLAEEVQDAVRRRVERTDVAGLLEHRRRGAVRPRGFRSRGHLLLRRVRRPEAGAAGCSAKRGNGSWPNGGCMIQKSDGPEID